MNDHVLWVGEATILSRKFFESGKSFPTKYISEVGFDLASICGTPIETLKRTLVDRMFTAESIEYLDSLCGMPVINQMRVIPYLVEDEKLFLGIYFNPSLV